MEKVLQVGGQDVRFRATMKTLLVYKAQTGREYLADVQKLAGLIVTGQDGKPAKDANGKVMINLAALDTEMLCAVAWAMARTADGSILPLEEWLDQFEEFPIMEILAELIPVVNASMKLDAKNA